MDESDRRRVLIMATREANEQRTRELRGEIMQRARASAAGWTPRREEPEKPEQKLDTMPPEQTDGDDWERWLAARLNQERGLILEAVGVAVRQLLDEERTMDQTALTDEFHSLKVEIAKLQSVVAQLREDRAADRAKVVDLPSPLSRRTVN